MTDPHQPLTEDELQAIYKRVEAEASHAKTHAFWEETRQLAADALVLAAECRRARQFIRNRNSGDH